MKSMMATWKLITFFSHTECGSYQDRPISFRENVQTPTNDLYDVIDLDIQERTLAENNRVQNPKKLPRYFLCVSRGELRYESILLHHICFRWNYVSVKEARTVYFGRTALVCPLDEE